MKKKFLTAMILGITLLSACGTKYADVAGVTESTAVAESASEAESADEAESVEVAESAGTAESAEGEEAQDAASFDEYELKNDLFGVRFKSYEETPNLYDETQIEATLTFEFINITGETFFKMDEEIQPGGTWEKVCMYPKTKWQDMAGVNHWIHYKLYDPDGNEIFAGGLVFKVDADIQVSEMNLFEE